MASFRALLGKKIAAALLFLTIFIGRPTIMTYFIARASLGNKKTC